MLDPSEAMTLPEPRLLLVDYITPPCKHECSIIKHVRHAKYACRVLKGIKAPNPVKHALMRATYGGQVRSGLDPLPRGYCCRGSQTCQAGIWKPRRVKLGQVIMLRYSSPLRTDLQLCKIRPHNSAGDTRLLRGMAPLWDPAIRYWVLGWT